MSFSSCATGYITKKCNDVVKKWVEKKSYLNDDYHL